jgi:hypothetical protein
MQGAGLGGLALGLGGLALAAGGCAVVARLQAEAPTLASLIGALDLGPLGGADDPSPQGGPAAACAAAARRALHADDAAALAAPSGGGGGPLHYSLRAAAPPGAAAELLPPAEVQWAQPGAEGVRAAEAAAWAALRDLAAPGGARGRTEAQFLVLLKPLLAAAHKARAPLSHDLLCKLLQAAAGERKGHSVSSFF